MTTLPSEDELNALAQIAAQDAVFSKEERASPEPPTEEERVAYAARTRDGYYIPGVGAFDWWEDGPGYSPDDFTKPTDTIPAFHISPHTSTVEPSACANCGGALFHLGSARFFTAIRCVNCGREWCEASG